MNKDDLLKKDNKYREGLKFRSREDSKDFFKREFEQLRRWKLAVPVKQYHL